MLILKNKAEREAFLKNFHEWSDKFEPIRNEHMKMVFYRYKFKNGAYVYVTECTQANRTLPNVRYNLILPDGDNYNPYDQNSGHSNAEFRSYTLEGCGMGIIVDYLTKRRTEI